MRAHVYSDAALTKHAGRFVWLSIDTEKEQNAGFLEQYPVEAWPTLFVVDPGSGAIALKWLGSATVPQLEKMLDDAERALRPDAKAASKADALFAQGTQHYAAKESADAVEDFRSALKAGGLAWPARARGIESLVLAALDQGDLRACAATAVAEAPAMPRGASFANTVGTGLSCALAVPPGEDWRAEAIAALEPLTREAVGLSSVLADDRSSLYDSLVSCREEAQDPVGARKVAGDWLAFLEAEAAKAKSAEERAAFDAHRVSAALKLGDPSRAVSALEQTERDLPADYNAPARLAQLYLALGRFEDAVKASDRALVKVYGPRRLRLLESRADILKAQGDVAGARRVLREALEFADTLPAVQKSERQLQRIESRLKALEAP
ncbi:MAG TPA: tetratricopeptide repeat protein [Myxococcales bacterium]|jgi:tetratricopeptide (TPR) repeat protein